MEYNIDQLDGVGPVTVKKLKEFGVTSLFDICVRGSREIAEITGTAKFPVPMKAMRRAII